MYKLHKLKIKIKKMLIIKFKLIKLLIIKSLHIMH